MKANDERQHEGEGKCQLKSNINVTYHERKILENWKFSRGRKTIKNTQI